MRAVVVEHPGGPDALKLVDVPRPEELASMVLECLRNPYMNCEVVRVDGGIRMPPK